MFGLSLGLIFSLIILAFIFEYIDSTLGMGYGTTLTPILLILGYSPLQIVPVILISELITGLLASFFHHREGNANFKPKDIKLSAIIEIIKSIGYAEVFKRTIPLHLKVALLLALCSIVGTITAVLIAISIPSLWIKFYISFIVLFMGIIIIVTINKRFTFSWKKIIGLGLIASFNKGISGGGYGPIITGGQILSGVEGKSAVGITSLAEGLTCAVGIITYILAAKKPLDLRLAPFIILGAVLSVPLSAKSVKNLSEKKLKIAIAVLTMILGVYTLYQIITN